MSYKSRERKRKAKYEPQIAASSARAKRNEKTALRYFLAHVGHDCRCVACGGYLRKGAEMVYRKNGAVKLCVPCADSDPLVVYRPSAAWEARNFKPASKGPAWMRGG
jgi:hypothetical protein